MAVSHQNLLQNSVKPLKFQPYPQKANGISFWAFLLSILIYISIFYIFNLSPSSLLNTTKFWFFISNNLILIIAADFGAFSSSRKQAEIYEEFAKNSRGNSFPSFESQYREREIVIQRNIVPPPRKVENSQQCQEKIKEDVVVDVPDQSKYPENKLQIVVKGDPISEPNEIKSEEKTVEFNFHPKDSNEAHEEKKSETNIENEEDEEKNEFSTMSNEELNRRVEEFISRFNRQIRLQAVRNRIHQIQY